MSFLGLWFVRWANHAAAEPWDAAMDEIDKELLRLGSYRNFLGYAKEAFEDGKSAGDPGNGLRKPAFIQSRRFEIFNTFCIERGRAIVVCCAIPLLVLAVVMKLFLGGDQAAPNTSGARESSALARFFVFSAYFAITGTFAWRLGARRAIRKLKARMKEDVPDD